MKNLILVLSVMSFLSCKKESNELIEVNNNSSKKSSGSHTISYKIIQPVKINSLNEIDFDKEKSYYHLQRNEETFRVDVIILENMGAYSVYQDINSLSEINFTIDGEYRYKIAEGKHACFQISKTHINRINHE